MAKSLKWYQALLGAPQAALEHDDRRQIAFVAVLGCENEESRMTTVSVRYIVDDVDAAIAFYTGHLDFNVAMQPAPTFAMLDRGDLRLLLSAPGSQGGGGQAMADGTRPVPGGWNRISLPVTDLPAVVDGLRKNGVKFRSDIVHGVSGDQILVEDPFGNLVELFEFKH